MSSNFCKITDRSLTRHVRRWSLIRITLKEKIKKRRLVKLIAHQRHSSKAIWRNQQTPSSHLIKDQKVWSRTMFCSRLFFNVCLLALRLTFLRMKLWVNLETSKTKHTAINSIKDKNRKIPKKNKASTYWRQKRQLLNLWATKASNCQNTDQNINLKKTEKLQHQPAECEKK